MKTQHLIFLSTAVFTALFYHESIGLNLGLLAIFYASLLFYKTPRNKRTPQFLLFFATSCASSFAFAWYGDFSSFLALFTSLVFLFFNSGKRKLKLLLALPLFITNVFSFLWRFFSFKEWYFSSKTSGMRQKIISVILIPLVLITVFFAVYATGSDHFSEFFTRFDFSLDFWEILGIALIGFFLAFTFWSFKLYGCFTRWNRDLGNNLTEANTDPRPTYKFMDIDAERTSGVISLGALNILLLIFVVTFNFEQFVEISKTPNQLSTETHERVNAVILSIVMAIVVIMFYFKGSFNFDIKGKTLKIMAKIWIVLNGVLIISAVLKNSEYIINLGLTYKRLGVYTFLLLALIGLIVTFKKIQKRKTNAFLFNQMIWFFYGTVLICSYINWGGLITSNNSKRPHFEVNFHKESINFNDKQLLKYAEIHQDETLKSEILNKIDINKDTNFLSKILYYETVKTK